jgi:hypothetical protein
MSVVLMKVSNEDIQEKVSKTWHDQLQAKSMKLLPLK